MIYSICQSVNLLQILQTAAIAVHKQILTCQFFALCMNPVMATATLYHLALSLVILVALITEKTEVS